VHKFNDELQATSSEFYDLMHLNRGFASKILPPLVPPITLDATPEEKAQFQVVVAKWEKWQADMYEAQMFVEECRPYAPTSGRYYIFSDEQLSFDPFGYYKPRLLSDNVPHN
jgi:hypothetical protein